MNKLLTIAACILCLYASAAFSQASELSVAGANFEKAVQVAGQSLNLNGAGVRTMTRVKVYAAGLYLAQPKTTAAEVFELEGPKRLKIVMLRELSTEDLAASFTTALNRNTTRQERIDSAAAINQLVGSFTTASSFKADDAVELDLIPGVGVKYYLNGRLVGDPIDDPAFEPLLLRVWIGSNPVDAALKAELLRGLAPATNTIERKGRQITE